MSRDVTDSVSAPEAATFTERVAAEVRAEMARRKVTQTALAKALGCSQAAVGRRLMAEVPMDTDDLERIARHLRVSPLVLLSRAA